MFRKVNNVHFVGIGGIGMSGIAELLLNLGFQVTGSDLKKSSIIDKLISKGAKITFGHKKENIKNSDALVYSSAVKLDNPEILRAKELGITIVKRAEMLGELIALKPTSIGVSGTHGKTSTSSIIGSVLTESKLEPTLVVGGYVKNINSNSKLGSGNIIVVEADEYDKSFLALRPTISIVTNIELDHTDCYQNMTELQDAFLTFCNSVPFYGVVIVCTDSPSLVEIIPEIRRPVLTYGLETNSYVSASNIKYNKNKTTFNVIKNEKNLGKVHMNVPGKHNVTNALASVVLGLELEIPFSTISNGIKSYMGVNRRFEIKKTHNDIIIIDDYAHHPTEIYATLKAAKDGWGRRIIAIFQPHLYTRTRDFYKEFANSFLLSDILIVTDIFGARENPIKGISGRIISNCASEKKHPNSLFISDWEILQKTLENISKPGDMIITLGAGNIWRFNQKYYQYIMGSN